MILGQIGKDKSEYATFWETKVALASARAFRFKVLSCRIYEAYGDNKAKVDVSVGPDFQGFLNMLLDYADSQLITASSSAKVGHVEVILTVLLASSLPRTREEVINHRVEMQSLAPAAYDEQRRCF